MSKVIFKDESAKFLTKNGVAMDNALAHMAQDIEIIIKSGGRTPVKTGQLKANVRHRRTGLLKYRVDSDKEYSAVQELGKRNGSKTFTHYSTPGTGAHWFRDAILKTTAKANSYFREAARGIGA